MKKHTRIIAFFLAVVTLVTTLTACSRPGNDEDPNKAYITKGVFYEMAMEMFNCYPVSNTTEELENATNYDLVAQVMIDWELQTEQEAKHGLDKTVTRQTVITTCIRNMYFVKEGDPSKIKDARKCDDPQAIANAVETGIVELENGYIAADRKMTYDDCLEIIEKSIEVDSNSTFESEAVDGDTGIEYAEDSDAVHLGCDDIDPTTIIVYRNDEDAQAETDNVVADNSVPKVVPLGTDTDVSADIIDVKNSASEMYFDIPANEFNKNRTAYSAGQKFTYSSNEKTLWTPDNPKAENGKEISEPISFAGIVSRFEVGRNGYMRIYYYELDEEDTGRQIEKEEKENSKKDNSTGKYKGINLNNKTVIKAINKMTGGDSGALKKAGISIKAEGYKGDGIEITASKQFKLTDMKYTGTQQWRNPEITPTVTASLALYKVGVKYNKIGGLLIPGSKSNSIFSVNASAHDKFSITSGELKYTPDCNGNGKFPSNWSRSRLTNADSGGAKRIKICKVPIFGALMTGLYFTAYLSIKIDGTITIESTITGADFTIKNQAGKKKVSFNVPKPETIVSAQVQLQASLDLGVEFSVASKCIANAELKPTVLIYAEIKIKFGEDVADVHCSKDELEEFYTANNDSKNKVATCFKIKGDFYVSAQVCNDYSFLGRKLKKLGVTIEANTKSVELFNLHFDNGKITDAEVAGFEGYSDGVKYHQDNISISDYAVTVNNDEVKVINITGLPLSKGKIDKSWRGLRVDTEDKSGVEIEISKDYSKLYITPKKPGVYKCWLYINKKVGDGKFDYKNEFVVTVPEQGEDDTSEKNKNVGFNSFAVDYFNNTKMVA